MKNKTLVKDRYTENILRHQKIRLALAGGFLDDVFQEVKKPAYVPNKIDSSYSQIMQKLVDSTTRQSGIIIVGILVLKLTIKSIEPIQSTSLKKSKPSFPIKGSTLMRSFDVRFITPFLRQHKLLSLNADGIMMTRSLAENYPYSKLYKAAIRGSRKEWLQLVDWIEEGTLPPKDALKQMLALLLNKSEELALEAEKTLSLAKQFLLKQPDFQQILSLVRLWIDSSAYSARIFEIAIHAFFQVLEDRKLLEGYLKPLSQMRSANKKHGNIGDIEITLSPGKMDVLETWDAKYGKPYLREELEELNEKLHEHPQVQIAGFVTDSLSKSSPT